MTTGTDELEDFKTRVNLTEFATAQGYVLDRKASSRNSALMVHSRTGISPSQLRTRTDDWIILGSEICW